MNGNLQYDFSDISFRNRIVSELSLMKQALRAGTPALRLFVTAAAEQVGETACDIVHFSLFIRIIGMAVHVECTFVAERE